MSIIYQSPSQKSYSNIIEELNKLTSLNNRHHVSSFKVAIEGILELSENAKNDLDQEAAERLLKRLEAIIVK